MKKNRCVIYARVSSKEQEKSGFSIPSQLKLLRKYVIDNDQTILDEFIDVETAKKTGRENFTSMLEFIQEKNCDLILVEKTDRLYRNIRDWVALDDIGVDIHFVKENFILSRDSHSSQKFLHGIKVLMAKNYIDNLKEEIRKSKFYEVSQGRYCFAKPFGYKYVRDQNKKKVIVPDHDAPIIKEMFDLLAKGIYAQDQIRQMINLKFGRKISRTSYYRIVRNPLFAGTIKVKNFPVTKGIHEPIVSEEQFRICQKILNGNLKTITPIQKNNPEFPLRNFVGCAKCGRNITGGYSQGRSKKYPYYRCLTSGCHVNVGKKFLEDLFYDQLKLLQPDRRVLKLFEVVVRNIWVQHNKTQSKFQTLLRKQIVELEKKKRRIEELVIDRVFDIATYKIKSQEIEKGLIEKRIELEKTKIDYSEMMTRLNLLYLCYRFFRIFGKMLIKSIPGNESNS